MFAQWFLVISGLLLCGALNIFAAILVVGGIYGGLKQRKFLAVTGFAAFAVPWLICATLTTADLAQQAYKLKTISASSAPVESGH